MLEKESSYKKILKSRRCRSTKQINKVFSGLVGQVL
nr:MAG TPA: hypothetical protein [Caudoviricetes sp.]